MTSDPPLFVGRFCQRSRSAAPNDGRLQCLPTSCVHLWTVESKYSCLPRRSLLSHPRSGHHDDGRTRDMALSITKDSEKTWIENPGVDRSSKWRDVLPRKIGSTKKKRQPAPRFSQIVLESVQSN